MSPDPDEGAWCNYMEDTDFVGTLEVRNADADPLLAELSVGMLTPQKRRHATGLFPG
jgi:hypothetical protein